MEPDSDLPRGSHVPSHEVADLYAAACPGLIGFLTVLGGNRADAEEVAQDAFVKLMQHWPKVREYDDPQAWLRTVGARLMISRLRRRQVAARGLHLLGQARTPQSQAQSTDRLDIAAGLAALTVDQRAVLLLHHVHDLSVDDVARQLRVPVGTVKSRLARARAALAPLLADETRSAR